MSHPVHRFGDFIIDTAARELWHGGHLVALPPKSFECLAYLLEHRERAVGRDELISAVWGRVDVSDALLAQTLLRARRAVNDTGSGQTAIRTVPRFGYRWVGAVTAETIEASREDVAAPARTASGDTHDAAEETTAETAFAATSAAAAPIAVAQPVSGKAVESAPMAASIVATPHTPSHARRRSGFLIAALLALALVVISIVAWRMRAPVAVTAVASDLVVVLPVRISSAGTENAWIRLGAMDYIASRLRDDGHLKVLPSEQVVKLVENSDEQDARGTGAPRGVELKTGAAYVLQPAATPAADGWDFSVDVYHDEGVQTLHAHAATPLEAAAKVVAQALESMGVRPREQETVTSFGLNELLHRVDAAALAGDLDGARKLIAGASAEERESPELRVRAGQLEFRSGHVDEAETTFKSLTAAGASPPASVRALAQMGLGAVAVRRGEYAAAEREYSASIASFGNGGDVEIGHAYLGRAVAHAGQQQYDAALADFGRARVELERVGDQLGAARVDANIGIAETARARYNTALADLDRAIATFTRFGVRDDLVASLLAKTRALQAVVDPDEALATSERAWQLVQPLENRELFRRVGAERVRTLLATGQLNAVEKVLGQIDARDHAAGDAADPDIQALRARLLLEQGRAADALAMAQPLLAATKTPAEGSSAALLDAADVVLRAALRTKQVDVAQQAVATLQSQDGDDNQRKLFALMREAGQAQISSMQGKPDASDHFEAALKAADDLGIPEQTVMVASACVIHLVEAHQIDKAAGVLGRLAGYSDRDFRAAHAAAVFYAASGDAKLAEAAQSRERALAGERPQPLAWP